ncbi:hypothetical protein ABPG72_004120 [Tetrahymena utriculariae]
MESIKGTFQIVNRDDNSSPENGYNENKMMVLLLLIGFFLIYYLILLYCQFTMRNHFPISERSYKLTLLDGICSMLFVNIILISSIITNEHNFLLAPNFCYCSIDKFGLGQTDIEFYENNKSKANTIKAFQFLNNFLKFFKTINYLLRTFRLSYVFYFNIKHIEKQNSMIHKSVIGKNSVTDINNGNTNFVQHNQNCSSDHQKQLNINVATYNTQNSYGENTQQHNTAQNYSNHLGSHRQAHFQESLIYSDISFGNHSNSNYIPQTRLTYLLKRENLLIGISLLISLAFATIFYFIPSASPFLFWNIQFSSDLQDTHIYDNIIFICMNFFLIIVILFCLMSVKNIDDNYKIKYEIYIMLAIFTVVGNIIQFQCPKQNTDYVFDENSYPIFGLVPYKLAISGLLDFIAINIEIVLPIHYSSKERPFYNQNIVQDSLPFFCSKYKNFIDFLVCQQRPNQSQINSSSQCLAEILNLYIEMKNQNQNQNQKDIDQITNVFQKFDCLVPAFRSENVDLDSLFEIQGDKVVQARENVSQQSLSYQNLYQKTTEILEKYQKIFMKTPQYEFLFKRYQMQNQICLCLQDFNMTGDYSN